MFFRFSATAVFLLMLSFGAAHAAGTSDLVPANPPVALPSFTFQDSKGQTLNLADFKGRPVLLNLWATWCGPCVQEMPSLDHLQALLADKNLVVIALDQEHDGATLTASFFQRHEIHNLGIYVDPSVRASSILHARGLPTSFLIGADGKMNSFIMGATDWASPAMVALIRERLSDKEPTPSNQSNL